MKNKLGRCLASIFLGGVFFLAVTGCSEVRTKLAATQMNKQINYPFGTWDVYKLPMDPAEVSQKLNETITLENPETKTTPEGYYAVFAQEDGSRVYIRFSQEKNIVIDVWGIEKLLSAEDFSSLSSGKTTSTDIYAIDSYTTLLVPSDEGESPYSQHRLKDGTLLVIIYTKSGSSFLVESMRQEQDPSGFFGVILPEDLPE